MTCPACGAANESGRKFCGSCGTRIALACPACQAVNPVQVRFCGECGRSIADAATGIAPDTRVVAQGVAGAGGPMERASEPGIGRDGSEAGELKLVSVLFADLVGFTAASEQRDPEAVRETLTRYFETATTVVRRYGGTVEKFIGDAVMAVWGTPVAFEDDAERAVRAALDLVAAVEALDAGANVSPLRVRAAVMTGEAAVTPGARNQGLVAGDLVNTASRLQGVAPPGTVLVGEATAAAASSAIAFEPAGEHLLKGREAPVVAHRAVRVVGKRGGVGRSEGLEPPFTGRDAELRLVRELYHATASDRRARLVSIVGQAGVGKSRLLWEFSKYTDGLVEDILWHEGRSPAYGEGVTFWALGEMVRQRARILEGEDVEATRAKLASTVAEYVTDPADRRRVEPALRELLGVHEGRHIDRDELFAAWRTFFEQLAAVAPTVLVFEDLHWADGGLIDFIEHLLEWGRGQPIYMVTLARPELLDRRPTWGAAQRSFTSIALEPLPDGAMHTLLDGLVPGLPATGMRGILSRAGGVPLYAVETVRMLVHEGRLELSEGVYRPTGDLSAIAVPDTLQALISARLDALEPADRSLLQVAAVLGQTFSTGALAAVSGDDGEAVEARLRTLARREIVVLDTDPRSPERGHYGFVQALIREVAYSMLTRRERRARHVAAARYYESVGDEEVAGVLAGHYLDAYRASPAGPEADAVAAQARLAARAAADRAEALGSYDQARRYLEQALTVTTDDREVAELHERIGQAAQDAGRVELAIAALGEAAARYGRLGDRTARARAMARDGSARLFTGTEAVAMLTEAVEEFADMADTPEGVALQLRLAQSLIFAEQPEEALPMLERALGRAEQLDLVPLIADALVSRTTGLIGSGRHREAGVILRGTRELAETYGLTDLSLRAVSNVVFLEMSGDPGSGVRVARQGLGDARRLGRHLWWYAILGNAAQCAFRTGDWDWAMAELDAALEMGPEGSADHELTDLALTIRAFRGEDVRGALDALSDPIARIGDHQMDGVHRLTQARQRFAAGDLQAAHALAMEAAATTPFVEALALATAAQAAIRAGDRPHLRATADVVGRSRTHGDAMNADRALLAAAVEAERDPSGAAAAYAAVLERYRALGLGFDLAVAQANYAVLFPDAPDAVNATAEARATFAALGATAMLFALDGGWTGRAGSSASPAPPVAGVRARLTDDSAVR